ncbi:MAG: hypothetical protein Tsb0013_06780 [Phycisphaerales bacterium]
MNMVQRLRKLDTPHVIGALVTCGAVLGIASMIHPTDSAAIPEGMGLPELGSEPYYALPEPLVSLGGFEGRGFTAELGAGTPPTLRVQDELGTTLYDGLTLEEYLRMEPELARDTMDEGQDAWPEAIMHVDPDDAPW